MSKSMSKRSPSTMPMSKSGGRAVAILEAIPPEAVLSVFETVQDLFRTHGEIRKANDAHFNEMERLRVANADVHERLRLLRSMVLDGSLSEQIQLKLVEAICEVVAK